CPPGQLSYTCVRVEERVSQKLRSTRTREAILGALQFGGLLALTVLVPNAAGVLVKHVTRGSRARVRSAVYRLEKQELIRFETKNGKKFARITLKGQEYLSDKLVRKTRTGRWDGKW